MWLIEQAESQTNLFTFSYIWISDNWGKRGVVYKDCNRNNQPTVSPWRQPGIIHSCCMIDHANFMFYSLLSFSWDFPNVEKIHKILPVGLESQNRVNWLEVTSVLTSASWISPFDYFLERKQPKKKGWCSIQSN